MRKIKNPWAASKDYDCFGCAPGNPIGLHMEFFEESDEIISFWNPGEHYQGWTGTIHGGILSSLIDEACAWTIMRKMQTIGVTTRLQLRYKLPVAASESVITVRAKIVEQNHRLVFLQAKLENGKGETCVEGDVAYYVKSKEEASAMGFTGCEVEDDLLLPM